MCKMASMIVVPKNKAIHSDKTDSHHEIISEFNLREMDRVGKPALVPVELYPDDDDYSRPLSEWGFHIDTSGVAAELPDWWDGKKAEAACRARLKEWASVALSGWNVKEAYHPVHPFKMKPKKLSRKSALVLVKDWDSVWASVWDSVWASVGDSVGASVGASVWDSVGVSVGASVWASVWAYTGSLFPNIKEWKYIRDNPEPWKGISTLWRMGYVPSFDGKVWRLHAHRDARVVYEFTKEEVATA